MPKVGGTWCGAKWAAALCTISLVVLARPVASVSLRVFVDFAGLVATKVDVSVMHPLRYKNAPPALHWE